MTPQPSLGIELPRCQLMGLDLACVTAPVLLDTIFEALSRGEGGWLITANLDFLRRWSLDSEARALYAAADLRVADGMPLVWAARLQGDRVPERVTGSSLVWALAERAAACGRSVYLLGGQGDAAARAGATMCARWPALRLVGTASPRVQSPPSAQEVEALANQLVALKPDILMVGLGSPKQEHLIERLRTLLPATFMIGVGVSFSFVAGDLSRAPAWVQRLGLEWIHRMVQEPGHLAKRYLVDDLPFVGSLFLDAWRSRRRRKSPPRGPS